MAQVLWLPNTKWLWSLEIRVSKLSESGSIWGHYNGQTDLKLDSLSFLTLFTKFQSHLEFADLQNAPANQVPGAVEYPLT